MVFEIIQGLAVMGIGCAMLCAIGIVTGIGGNFGNDNDA